MEKISKLIIIAIFASVAGAFLLNGCAGSGNTLTAGILNSSPTPPANQANGNGNVSNANAANVTANSSSQSNKVLKKEFVLGKDSLDAEYGEVPFNHDTHAFQKYSPDGNSVIGCVECHHTDQPVSNLKPPLKTSEREVVLTFEVWKASDKKVSECRACHFQEGNVPDGKEMPVANNKELHNANAYHLNCNICHDEAAKLRPDLKKKPGFATGAKADCKICHKPA